jgi:hypothetical protein
MEDDDIDFEDDDSKEDDNFENTLKKCFGCIKNRIIAFQYFIDQQNAADGYNYDDINKARAEYNECLVLETNAKNEVDHLVEINNSDKSHVSSKKFKKALANLDKWCEVYSCADDDTDYHNDFWRQGDDYECLELKKIVVIVRAEIERLGNSKASIEEVKRFILSVSSKIRHISILIPKEPVTFREAMKQNSMKGDLIELNQMQDLAIPGISCKELYDLCTQLSEDFNKTYN